MHTCSQESQRPANLQIGSGVIGEVISPFSKMRSGRLRMRGTGIAESNAFV